MSLTPEQVRLFRHNGFLKLPSRLDESTIDRLNATIAAQIRDEVPPVVRDRQGRVVRLSDVWSRGEIFREAVASPDLLDSLESLLGPNIELILNRHNHAALRVAGDGTDYMHRDILQWTRGIITVLFYLTETTIENGCTRVIPGTHLLFPGFRSLDIMEDESLRQAEVLDQAVPVPMPVGGMLVLDSLLIHGAGPNRTAGSRTSLTMGYHSADELSKVADARRVLVRGERRYLGNDG